MALRAPFAPFPKEASAISTISKATKASSRMALAKETAVSIDDYTASVRLVKNGLGFKVCQFL